MRGNFQVFPSIKVVKLFGKHVVAVLVLLVVIIGSCSTWQFVMFLMAFIDAIDAASSITVFRGAF